MITGGAPGATRLHWIKSSYSGTAGNCVEVVGLSNGAHAVRDSKNPTGPTLVVTTTEWRAFAAGVRDGEFG